jgi:hypothetical protein
VSTATPGTDKYFAAETPELIGNAIMGRLQRIAEHRRDGSRHDAQVSAYNAYYGWEAGSGTTWRVDRDGEVGELANVRINRARTVLRSLVGLLTAAPFSWRVKARNGDGTARRAVLKGSNLLEFYWEQRGFQSFVEKAVEAAGCTSEAFAFVRWDVTKGDPVGLDTPEGKSEPVGEVRAGDIDGHVVMPWDYFRDEEYRSFEACPWGCVRLYLNKWELARQYPLDINGQPTDSALKSSRVDADVPIANSRELVGNEGDVVPVYFFFHDPSLLLPNGRATILVSGNCVLADGDLDYPKRPVERLILEQQLDTTHGYTSWWDTLGIQELCDALETAIASNQTALATQSISMVEGTKADVDAVSGLKVFYHPPNTEPPQPLQLTSTPPEVFEHIKEKRAEQRDMVGLNDVVQGQPDTAQMNAEAFALLASMAVQRNSPSQKQVLDFVGRLGKLVLAVLSSKVTAQRQTAIAGKQATATMRVLEWNGDELKPIDSVMVSVGNPLEQTAPGRFQLAQMYLQMNVLKTPQDLQQVVETGRLEQATESVRAEELNIAEENDELHQGNPSQVHWSDNHLLHCAKHLCVMQYADARQNPGTLQAWQTHIWQHYVEYYGLPPGMAPTVDPMYPQRIRILLGQQPPMPALPPGAPAGAPPPGHGPPHGAPPGKGPLPPAVAPPAQPGLPKSPVTGEPPMAPPPGVPHAA